MMNSISCRKLNRYGTEGNNAKQFIKNNPIVSVYLMIKILCTLVIGSQILILRHFLGIELSSFILKPFYDFLKAAAGISHHNHDHFKINSTKNEDNQNLTSLSSSLLYRIDSNYFPLRSICIYYIRELTRTQVYASMCTLPINIFNQYIFFFIIFWQSNIFLCNIYGTLISIYSLYYKNWENRCYFVKDCLMNRKIGTKMNFKRVKTCCICFNSKLMRSKDSIEMYTVCDLCNKEINQFVDNYITSDVMFTINLIESNSNEFLKNEILIFLWNHFKNNKNF
jgi:hypothetical protein